ncbi:MAG: phosphoribosylamine--glycine ligase [Gammaproteobacteria bacterium]|nr:phosphoribosylamine--glycine ligase [Gammaproteobacteria bacterium]
MNVLVIGSGGREHAIAWKIAQSSQVHKVYVAPGNAGTDNGIDIFNVNIKSDDISALLDFAKNNDIALTVVGPEAPLVLGITDAFQAAGLRIFGPNQVAAQLEGSKSFTKDFLAKHKIPTAKYQSFTDSGKAIEYLAQCNYPLVIKADGLASGKGVVITDTEENAKATIIDMLDDAAFGDAGASIVIEEFLIGEEASFICVVAGRKIVPLATSQDHKAIGEGDTGLNTGGMGAYSPAPVVDEVTYHRIMREVIQPTVEGLQSDGIEFTGFLYAGIMVHPDGTPNVLEFNVRLGDPETQPILSRMTSDLFELLLAATEGRLEHEQVTWSDQVALGVVLAAENYPEAPMTGDIISGLNPSNGDLVFHAGTRFDDGGNTVTAGGRVLCVVGLGSTVSEAAKFAYAAADKITWRGMYRRNDIGHRAIKREQSK